MVPTETVIPYSRNPRKNDAAVSLVAGSLKEFGWQQPIVVDKEMVIIVGHTRLLAAQQLGMKQVPIVIADQLTPNQAKAYRLADNRVGQEATWDFDLLSLEIGDLKDMDFNLDILGFNEQELLGMGEIDDVGFPDLGSGPKGDYRQITFTLHNDQADIVEAALAKAKQGDYESDLNENANGNAITFVCQGWLQHAELPET